MNKRDKQWFNEAVDSVTRNLTPSQLESLNKQQDLDFLRLLLPPSYIITQSDRLYFRCISPTGIDDGNGDILWTRIFQRIKEHFKERFLEVYHNTCYNHVDFVIYLKKPTQQHMYNPHTSGRPPATEIDQQNSGKGIREITSTGPGIPHSNLAANTHKTDTPHVATDTIKPFLMIDINACKNKKYTLYEIVQIFAQSDIQIVQKYPHVCMNFGHVLDAIRDGHKCARAGWNGKGMFIYHVPANRYPSVTNVAINEFGSHTSYNEYFAIKNVDGTVSTWVPSINDCFATDWMIV